MNKINVSLHEVVGGGYTDYWRCKTNYRVCKGSVMNGIQYIQNYEIIILPDCVNFLREIANYTWAVDRAGTKLNEPTDHDNHLMDAMRYAMEGLSKPVSLLGDTGDALRKESYWRR